MTKNAVARHERPKMVLISQKLCTRRVSKSCLSVGFSKVLESALDPHQQQGSQICKGILDIRGLSGKPKTARNHTNWLGNGQKIVRQFWTISQPILAISGGLGFTFISGFPVFPGIPCRFEDAGGSHHTVRGVRELVCLGAVFLSLTPSDGSPHSQHQTAYNHTTK